MNGGGNLTGLTAICIRRPVVAWVIMAAVVMLGLHGLMKIGVSQLPDVNFPVVQVLYSWQGAAPEVVENDVVEVVEDALAQVQGITGLTATAFQGGASFTIELDIRRNVDAAMQEVQARLSQAQLLLPKDLEPAVVQKFNPEEMPFMWVSLSGAFSRQELADAMRFRVLERVQRVPGVGSVTNGSNLERNIRIWFDPDKLVAHGLTVPEAVARLQANHLELPAGRLSSGGREINLRILGEATDLTSLRAMPVGGSDQAPIRLGDVAAVEDGFADVRSFFRNNGRDAQAIGVSKQLGQNTVAVADAVKAEFAAIRKDLPAGMSLEVNFDATQFIKQSVHDVQYELVLAVILTALTCLLFLGSWSAAFNVVLAIPMSILGTVAVLQALGWTLNTFTLLALALVTGIVVDDAIMVQENIARNRALGLSPREAAWRGTTQIAFAALASSVAVIVIFIPVTLVNGVIGQFFMQFGVTLCVAVAFSYLEAITLAPARCAQFMAAAGDTSRWARGTEAAFGRLARTYRHWLAKALRRPKTVLAVSALIFVASLGVVAGLRKELSPAQDEGSLFVRLETSPQAAIEETDALVRQAEDWLAKRAEVSKAFTIVGGFDGAGVNTAFMFVTMAPKSARTLGQAEFSIALREQLSRIPGLTVTVQDPSGGDFGGGRGTPIELTLRGDDWPTLITSAKSLVARLRSAEPVPPEPTSWWQFSGTNLPVVPNQVVTDIDLDWKQGAPELAITPDRDRIQDLGLRVQDVAVAVGAMLSGQKIGKFTLQSGRRVDMRVGVLESARRTADDLGRLRLRTPGGALVPLASLVSVAERGVVQQIIHRDNARAITIYGDVKPGVGSDAGVALAKRLAADLPPGVSLVESGQTKQTMQAFADFGMVFLMGLIAAYLVLAAQFNHLVHPLTVLTILPLAVAGGLLGLAAGGFSINIFSVIGILLLMGLVKKNSIILVDQANQVRAAGGSTARALLVAGQVRLRPILMTSVASMMAALPIAIGLGAGSELRQPMAVSILGGVLVSTCLSLFTVPAFYAVTTRRARRVD